MGASLPSAGYVLSVRLFNYFLAQITNKADVEEYFGTVGVAEIKTSERQGYFRLLLNNSKGTYFGITDDKGLGNASFEIVDTRVIRTGIGDDGREHIKSVSRGRLRSAAFKVTDEMVTECNNVIKASGVSDGYSSELYDSLAGTALGRNIIAGFNKFMQETKVDKYKDLMLEYQKVRKVGRTL